MTATMRGINLSDLATGCPALTPAIGMVFAEAAAICLKDRGHTNSIILKISGDVSDQLSLTTIEVDDQISRSHNDLQDATEAGACGIAILLVRKLKGYTVVERSVKGTGIDYWLGDEDDLLFQNKARLEVSGMLNANKNQIAARVKQKLEQTTPSDGSMPAHIVVVEFGEPHIRMVEKR